jgi:hypothetical protein
MGHESEKEPPGTRVGLAETTYRIHVLNEVTGSLVVEVVVHLLLDRVKRHLGDGEE